MQQRKDHEREQKFKLVYEQLFGPVLAYTKTLTNNHDQAKDIVQNCFIALWQKRPDLIESKSLKSFLYTTAYNSFIDLYRKDQRKNQILDELKYSMAKENLSEVESNEDSKIKKLKKVIDQLPPKCREIILLNKKDGLKYKEIAVLKNISEKTVESQMRIAFAKIREAFDNNDSFLFLLFS
ncbi:MULTISPECIES: RNA polymerase sigma factor [unclassified Arenibacter]|uniref:RNA polymerase sigma factor n=1 Tax=unclassified Arenibacter TaxID=2615047 RepID=UPI000E343389|nr:MULTISPECIES: RNA polymerase sigma-70 factor [unclassified Arenibacter]MCM4162297.1 RNA polymerase sigma-70 factor [Arenibacter sp. A80]RFT57899.1 RNA polymerase sigma-70 factor [Arenibacter sp. P308M17]